LVEVCARLRRRLRAASVGFFAPGPGGLALLASDGRLEGRMAERVIDARQPIAP
jgi:hypothetical protein